MDISTIPTYDEKLIIKDCSIIKTKVLLVNIEKKICAILDKYPELAKYYININENYFNVEFNVDIKQYEAMCKTMFQVYIYKENDCAILCFTKEILEHEQWSELNQYFMNKF